MIWWGGRSNRDDARAVVGAIGNPGAGWRVEGRGEWVGGVVVGGRVDERGGLVSGKVGVGGGR